MYTSIVLAALMNPGAAPQVQAPEVPSWQENYTAARERAQQEKKPLAVFVGPSATGWKYLAPGRKGAEIQKLLAENYVCVWIDAGSAKGKKLAARLELKRGLVISTRDGEAQAFRYNGRISTPALTASLKRYATDFVSTATETVEQGQQTQAEGKKEQSAGTTTFVSCAGGACGVGGSVVSGFSGCAGGSCGVVSGGYVGGCYGGGCGTSYVGGYGGGCGVSMGCYSGGGCGRGFARGCGFRGGRGGCRGGRCR